MNLLTKILQWLGLKSKIPESPPAPPFHDHKLRKETQISYDEIKTFIERGDLQQAKKIIDRERQVDPNEKEIRFLYAHWLHIQNRFSEAADILQELILNHPDHKYFLEYAQVLFAQNNLEESEKYCYQVLDKQKQNRDALLLIANIYLSRVKPQSEKNNSTDDKISIKNLYATQVDNFDQLINIIPDLTKLKNQNPDDQQLIEILAEIYSLTGENKKLQELMQKCPSDFIQGKIKLIEGDAAGAAAIFEKLVAEDDRNSSRLQNYALAEEQSGNLDKALQFFQKVLQINPQNLIARHHFQHLAVITGNQKILDDFEKSLVSERGDLSGLYAQILEKRGEYNKALEFYAKTLDLQTNEKTVIHSFASLAAKTLSITRALKILDKLVKKYPEDQELLDVYLEVEKRKIERK